MRNRLEDIARETSGESVTVTVGEDFISTLSQNTAASTADRIVELVANAYDADATRVELVVDEVGRTMRIKDDGSGMDRNGILGFYRVGDSDKVKEPVSPRFKRKRWGKFGLAAWGLPALCESYDLITEKEGKQRVVNYVLGTMVKPGTDIGIKIFPTRNGYSGTEIVMKELKFDCDSSSVKAIKRRVEDSLRVDAPNFKVFFNDEILKPRKITHARKFLVDAQSELIGPVQGLIYLAGRQFDDGEWGTHVRVNDRRVGDPEKLLNLHKENSAFAKRVRIEVDASGMEKYILMQRNDFTTGPALKELQAIVKSHLADVFRYAMTNAASTKSKGIGDKADVVIKQVHDLTSRVGFPELSRGILVIAYRENVPDNLSAEFRSEDGQNTIALNRKHPLVSPEAAACVPSYRGSLEVAVAEALALSRYRASGNPPKVDFLTERKKALDAIVRARNPAALPHQTRPLIASAFYEDLELEKAEPRLDGGVQYLIERRAVYKGAHGILGRDVDSLLRDTFGYVPLPQAMKEWAEVTNMEQSLKKFEAVIQHFEGMSPFVINHRGLIPECYFVNLHTGPKLAPLIRDVDLRMRGEGAFAKLHQYIHQYATDDQLLQEIPSFESKNEVNEFLAEAKKQGTQFDMRGNGYYLPHVVRAMVQKERRDADIN